MMGVMPLLNPYWEARLGRAGALTALMIASAVAFVGFSLSQALLVAVSVLRHGNRHPQYNAAAISNRC